MNTKLFIWIGGGVVGVMLIALIVWLVLFRTSPSLSPSTQQGAGFGTAPSQTTGVSTNNGLSTQNTQNIPVSTSDISQKVFKIADGPVTTATFVQTFNPTTTLARYVLQENGHVMDQPIDVPGSVARAVSNTTIPGTGWGSFARDGSSVFLQYIDNGTLKTISLIFPVAATSSKSVTKPIQIQFLPDNTTAVAISPSGAQVAYLLPTASGSDAYIANVDGGNAKKLFSIGFSQLLLTWPAPGTLLLSMKSAAGVPGMIFSVDVKTGNILPLLYADGVTAMANSSFSYVLYQSDPAGNTAPASYAHDIKKAADIRLSFNPIPEKCVSSATSSARIYCAVPQSYFGGSYIDAWHAGLSSLPDMITSFSLDRLPTTNIVATPGSADGGVSSDILEMSVSPDDKYLLFIKKGDRSLWGVRLGQN